MGYSDPTRIRSNVVKVRFSDEEAALIEAVVNYNGGQMAVFLRELILEQAQHVLSSDSSCFPAEKRGTLAVL